MWVRRLEFLIFLDSRYCESETYSKSSHLSNDGVDASYYGSNVSVILPVEVKFFDHRIGVIVKVASEQNSSGLFDLKDFCDYLSNS